MNITSIYDIKKYEDLFSIKYLFNEKYKFLYGEVPTPPEIINMLIDNIPEYMFKNKHSKWLDAGCGRGYISFFIYYKLFINLRNDFMDDYECSNHITRNMLYLIDINENNINYLKSIYPKETNIFLEDFINWNVDIKFDVIITNPPYVVNGIKKVPTMISDKVNDGITLWPNFIKKSLLILKEGGYLSTIIPSIWMKRENSNFFLGSYDIKSLYCYKNNETNKIFNGEAQTPTSLFVLRNESRENKIELYDRCFNRIVKWNKDGSSIPVFGSYILNKLGSFLKKYGNIYKYVIKTNMPSKKVEFSDIKTDVYRYPNIKTCKLKDKVNPNLEINYSDKSLLYYNEHKLILAHKMYGFPFLDVEGIYGVSNRDNYIIKDMSYTNLKRLKKFLESKLVLYIYESTRYRMKYLEKNAFEFIIDITNISDFPFDINDNSIFEYFKLTDNEIEIIKNYSKISYNIM